MRPRLIIALVAGFLILLVVRGTFYTVNEAQQVVVTQLGRPIDKPVGTPGLHMKVPFIEKANYFERRWLEWDGDSNQIPTRDKKFIWVDVYARWRIENPLRFYQAVGDERGAQSRLDDIVDGETRNAVASFDLIEVVRSSNRPFQATEELEGIGAAEAMAHVATGREKIAQIVLGKAAAITPQFGIQLEDVRFKRINYVDSVQQKVFERMISERKRIAERSRSEGQGRAAEIRGQKERDMLAASSAGYKSAQELKGTADAKATAIYSRAYGKDAEFYQFSRAMETLNGALDDKTWLILSTDSELLRYLKGAGGGN